MALLNTYYRAFLDYRKNTDLDKVCKRERKVLAKLDNAFERFEVTKYQIEIDESWVLEIEKGLEFIEKAVKEERQFIRTNGEIVPIEKVRKVSRDSVAHLAKHSEMITHIPDDPNDTVVPDKIYMVEKLNDYAVYENRFLYMLLCYLRDFIQLRIQKITDIRMTYICDFEIKRNLQSKKRTMEYQTSYHEDRKDNPYPIDNDSSASIIKRINDCGEIVNMLLGTQLMAEVSKAPMVKPPIVKTNVLKMNNNFKNALVLYDYIVNYKGQGYDSRPVVKNYIPLDDDVLDEFMELPIITDFLTYKYGNDLTKMLYKEYLQEEDLKRDKEAKELTEQIKRMRKKVMESGKGVEEYMLLLEKRNRMLEEDSQNLVKAKLEIENLNKQIEDLNEEINKLNSVIKSLQNEIEKKIQEIIDLHAKYQAEIEEINRLHEEALLAKDKECEARIEDFIKEQDGKIEEARVEIEAEFKDNLGQYINKAEELEDELRILEEKQDELLASTQEEKDNLLDEINNLKQTMADKVRDYETRIREIEADKQAQINEAKATYEKLTSEALALSKSQIRDNEKECNDKVSKALGELKQLVYERNLMAAELRSLRIKEGLVSVSEEYTDKERFEELETEFMAFNRFFKAQWNLTKKQIRKQLLWVKPEKKKTQVPDGGLSDNATTKEKEYDELTESVSIVKPNQDVDLIDETEVSPEVEELTLEDQDENEANREEE